jgi:hypothetical protein
MRQAKDDHCSAERKGIPHCASVAEFFVRAAVITALLSVMLAPASAATEVRGQPDNIYLQAENASISEVLDALSAEFKLTYSLKPMLGRAVTGVYSGTLRQVLTRVLDRHDFVIKILDDGIEIKWVSPSRPLAMVIELW